MANVSKGTLPESAVALEQAPSVTEGSSVSVSIEPLSVSEEGRRRWILELCGTWENDPSLPAIFDEIARERHAHRGGEIPIP